MKLIRVSQLNPQKLLEGEKHSADLYLNKDIIRWAHLSHVRDMTYTTLTLIADDKPLYILETPDEINKLCNFIQEVSIHDANPRSPLKERKGPSN